MNKLATKAGLDDWWGSDPASREDLVAVFDRFATLVAMDCIAMIQLKMPRNGRGSPENVQSKKHINDIADAYGIALPLPSEAYDHHIASIMAGADAMAGDGGYQEASLKSPQFLESQARYNEIFNKVTITAADVQRLREMTDHPLMECKRALTACNGNMDQAVEYLRNGRHYRTYV
jgi:hypothetical protein